MITTNAIDAMVIIFLLLVLVFAGREVTTACAAFFVARDGVFLTGFGGCTLWMLGRFLFFAARDGVFLTGSDGFVIFS
jgi:hypothetical protein